MRLSILRKLESYEYDSLPIFLYNSITQDENSDMLDTSIIEEDTYQKYIKDFGLETDFALARERDGRLSGIIWTRLFKETDKSFGFVDENTPEITLSVLAGYNQQKIGKELLELLFNELKLLGYKQVSVSLDNNNDILDVYLQVGFEEYSEDSDNNRKTYLKVL